MSNSRESLTCESCDQTYSVEDSDATAASRFCSRDCECDAMAPDDEDDEDDTALPGILSRARSVIEESDGADEHGLLIGELTIAEAQAVRLLAFVQTVALGKTDVDTLALMAAKVLAAAQERRSHQRRSEGNSSRSEAGPERRSWKERRIASASGKAPIIEDTDEEAGK